MMAERGFLSDILGRISSQSLLGRGARQPVEETIEEMCSRLDAMDSEASVLILARQMLDRYRDLSEAQKLAFFVHLDTGLGQDSAAMQSAIDAWQAGEAAAARRLHFAAEPRSQGLIRKLNSVPGATAELVQMRSDLLKLLKAAPELRGLDQDFEHLFASWFSRGFLEIRRIEWSTPASILEKIIAYEAVHEISDWDDLRSRVGDSDRRLFAFFHPAMPGEPLIFVEVALAAEIPTAIAPILDAGRKKIDPAQANTAVFYSISNCQAGLRGISFGNFLIKQVVAELQRDLPHLGTFVTLSPVPRLRSWAEQAQAEADDTLDPALAETIAALSDADPAKAKAEVEGEGDGLRRLAAHYLTGAKRPNGVAYDPVAHFHLGNGAQLHAVHARADLSPRGQSNSWGVMVNYLYDDGAIEENHQNYVADNQIVVSPEVRKLIN